MSTRASLARQGIDGVTLLLLPAALFIIGLFVYPFLYGLVLSFHPKEGGMLANYLKFFADPFLYDTIGKTLALAVPVTLLNVAFSVPVALKVRLMHRPRWLTTILVIPITLGTVLVAEGMLNYFGPRGWFNRAIMTIGLSDSPVRLIHNYWGVFLSLVITGFPFTFLLTLSYVTGIDPALEQAGAMLGARSWERFKSIILPLLVPGLVITFLPLLRAGLLGVPLRRPARRPRRRHAGDLGRRLHRSLRGVRLFDGLRDRHDHGLRAGADRHPAPGRAIAGLSRTGRRREGVRA